MRFDLLQANVDPALAGASAIEKRVIDYDGNAAAMEVGSPEGVKVVIIEGTYVSGGLLDEHFPGCLKGGIHILPPQAARLGRARQPDPHRGVLRGDRRRPRLSGLAAGLVEWERMYNTVRPHQALGYLTPAEYLAA